MPIGSLDQESRERMLRVHTASNDNARKSGARSQCQHGVDALGIRADVL